MKLFCYLAFHCWHTAPTGMVRYCTNCSAWEVNYNSSWDVIQRWRRVSWEEMRDYVDTLKAGEL